MLHFTETDMSIMYPGVAKKYIIMNNIRPEYWTL